MPSSFRVATPTPNEYWNRDNPFKIDGKAIYFFFLAYHLDVGLFIESYQEVEHSNRVLSRKYVLSQWKFHPLDVNDVIPDLTCFQGRPPALQLFIQYRLYIMTLVYRLYSGLIYISSGHRGFFPGNASVLSH